MKIPGFKRGMIAATIAVSLSFAALASGRNITVNARIADPDGNPVAGATVQLVLPRYGLGEEGKLVEGLSDATGFAKLSGSAKQAYLVIAEKAGYYRTQTPRRTLTTEEDVERFGKGPQSLDIELRPIKQPVASIGKAVTDLVIPELGKKYAFDFEYGDLVQPYGKGKVADVYLEIGGSVDSEAEYLLKPTISFPNPLDGIQRVEFSPDSGSELKYPNDAPLSGYAAELSWETTNRSTSLKTGSGIAHIFRTRSVIDEAGNLKCALYGVLYGEFRLGPRKAGFAWHFVYDLNPTWTRSLEFRPSMEGIAGSGRIRVKPRPQ